MSLRGLPFQGHEWFYCDGCANPTVGRCCGNLHPWNQGVHGNIRDAIRAAHQQGHQFGYQPGYTCTQNRSYGGYNDFLGTLMLVDGMEDGNVAEEILGASMLGGGGGGIGGVGGLIIAEEMLDDDRDDRRDRDDDRDYDDDGGRDDYDGDDNGGW